jgi:hypothetical protein
MWSTAVAAIADRLGVETRLDGTDASVNALVRSDLPVGATTVGLVARATGCRGDGGADRSNVGRSGEWVRPARPVGKLYTLQMKPDKEQTNPLLINAIVHWHENCMVAVQFLEKGGHQCEHF